MIIFSLSVVWVALTELLFFVLDLLPLQAELGHELIEQHLQLLRHRLLLQLSVLVVGAAAQEFEELNILHLVVLMLLGRLRDHVHLAHAIAIYDPDFIGDDLGRSRHEFNAVILCHPFLARLPVLFINLSESKLICLQDGMVFVGPPDVIAELLPIGGRSALERVGV